MILYIDHMINLFDLIFKFENFFIFYESFFIYEKSNYCLLFCQYDKLGMSPNYEALHFNIMNSFLRPN